MGDLLERVLQEEPGMLAFMALPNILAATVVQTVTLITVRGQLLQIICMAGVEAADHRLAQVQMVR